MGFADKIRIVETARDKEITRELNQRIKRLSGCDWPPKNSAEATIILTRAGWSQTRIEQFCALIFDSFDVADVGELPPGYVSSGKDDWPTFTASLISGLEKWHRDKRSDFVPNDLQRQILNTLDGHALRKQELANAICAGEGSRLYRSGKRRKGDLNELLDLGLVVNKPDLGYFRPDRPPSD